MKTNIKKMLFLFLITIFVFLSPVVAVKNQTGSPIVALANSAEPPGIVVLATNAPDDLTINLEIPGVDGEIFIKESRKMWEQYFRIYYHGAFSENTEHMKEAVLRVSSSEKSFTCPIPDFLQIRYKHNTILVLDYENETISVGQPAYREPVLITARLVLTFIIEGVIFFLLGFRKKRSWLVFVILNLLTQGWLNLSISGADIGGGSSYVMLGFIGIEIVIFLVESIIMGALIKEHKWYRRVGCALLANAVSLGLGMLIINYLPI